MILFSKYAHPQSNLVYNGSFEEYNQCPDTINISQSNFMYVVDWESKCGSVDYYNFCGTGCARPDSALFGPAIPFEGIGFIGEIFWGGFSVSVREFIQGKLVFPLEQGKKYNFSMNIFYPDSPKYAVNEIGILFSSLSQTYNFSAEYFFQFTPQIILTNEHFWSERKKWINLNGSFIGIGGEEYLLIGNFRNNSETDTLFCGGGVGNYRQSYYYIDNISVVEDTSYHPIGIEEEQLERLKLTYHGGNLHLQGLLFQNRETELFLYSYDGKQVGSYTLPKGNNSIPLKLPQGIYLYSLNIGEQALKRGKIWVGGE